MQNLIKARLLIESLKLKRNPNDYQSYIETFRESLIDANPHQIETVIFALEKLESGGCILADEVGLGKTIEAGLVITQYRAKRRWNVLIIVPNSLSVQWQNQLKDLFRLNSIVITPKAVRKAKQKQAKKKNIKLSDLIFKYPGINIMGRELASTLERNKVLSEKDWDLIIVDEAHEIFANIYRRFNSQTGIYSIDSRASQRAADLRYLFIKHPILLLTATPIQNNLLELWGLASYLSEKNDLGMYHHFRKLFLSSETGVVEDKREELRKRIKNILIRNLRKDAELFMNYKFTGRICETLNFNMTKQEKALYDDISLYFDKDDACAYNFSAGIELNEGKYGSIRNLLKMQYRRLLGSSFAALKSGLETILKRLTAMKKSETETVVNIESILPERDFENDLEDDINAIEEFGSGYEETQASEKALEAEHLNAEIEEIKDYIKRAGEIKESSKEKILVNFLKDNIFDNREKFFEKTVIFTQSLASQRYLKEIFENNGFQNEVVLFSGTNRGVEVEEALRIWDNEVGSTYSEYERPTGKAAVREALVYYFKTRKKIFISTEAGAKGLNLQFCNVIINYDLPWNPQRIEQRIGRCHRYGQQKDVLVINCINADNETETRIYEILDKKLKLFRGVMDFSNEVLGALSKALNFEVKVNEILNKFRTPEERSIMLKKFEEEIDEETKKLINKRLQNTRNLINNLDENVKNRLKQISEDMPKFFSQYDNDLLNLIKYYARQSNLEYTEEKSDKYILITIFKPTGSPMRFYIGKKNDSLKGIKHCNLKSDFIKQIIEEIVNKTNNLNGNIVFNYSQAEKKSEILSVYRGKRGRWLLYKVNFSGLEEEEKLYSIIAVNNNRETVFLNKDETEAFLKIPFSVNGNTETTGIGPGSIQDKLKNLINEDVMKIQKIQQPRLEQKLHKLNIELEDTRNYLLDKEKSYEREIEELDKKIKSTFDAKEGKELIKEKAKRQKLLNNVRAKLLKFQQEFSKMYDKEENKLLEKRFLDTEEKLIFSLNFEVV
ncbi:MAG: DEAD/DEAH box helicase family protein [Spirochaetales bacterium]|nr:DEAD/DEAH box helicase family protein [Spirochaetales bacterium]